MDLEAGTARICRSFSSDTALGPTKTGREREIELSSRVRTLLFDIQPAVFPPTEDALVFPGQQAGFLRAANFRQRDARST